MSRKTRKQKELTNKKRQLKDTSKKLQSDTVNREFEFEFNLSNLASKKQLSSKKPDNSVRFQNTGTQRTDIIKTIVLATGIFVLEFMIYSRWFK